MFLVLAIPVLAQDSPQPPPLPSYFVVAPHAQLKPNLTFEEYGEVELAIPHGDKSIKDGKHWAAAMTVSGVPDGVEPDDVWVRQLKPSLVNAGWTFLPEERGQAKIGHYQKNGHDTWFMLSAQGSDDMRFDLVEVAPLRLTMKIPKPADKPGRSTPTRATSLPCLPSRLHISSSHPDDAPVTVTVDLGNGQSEDQFAGTGSIFKAYSAPPFQSPLFFQTIYRTALAQAGWKVVHAVHSADAKVIAHYVAGSRNIWAILHGGGGITPLRWSTKPTLLPNLIATATWLSMASSSTSTNPRYGRIPAGAANRPRNPQFPPRSQA